MKKLNPSNDWLEYRNDAVDHSDDEEFNDPARKDPQTFSKGSKHYGHVVSRTSIYKSQLKKDIKAKPAKKLTE